MPARRTLPRLLPLALAILLPACSPSSRPPVPGGTARATATATPQPPTPPTDVPSAIGDVVTPVAGSPPVAGRPWYLTIGDSVTSGFTVDPARNGVNSAWALQLQALLAASGRHWTLYDTACPGERTATYYTLCPGRASIPFLQSTSQHDAAFAAISAHRADLRAVFVDLGNNDLLDAQRRGVDLPTATAALRAALTRIVADLRAAAPGVPVVVCNFYDPLANAIGVTLTELDQVDAVVAQVAAAQHARIADFRDAINTVQSGVDPHLCDWVDCAHSDLHPTVAGHARLARAALAALLGT